MEEIPLDPNDARNNLGHLPVMKGEHLTLNIPDTVPKDAKRWLIYAFVTVIGPTDQYGRGYYTFSSEEEENGRKHQRFMNVGFFNDSTTSSTNFWIPASSSRALCISLNGVSVSSKKKVDEKETCGLSKLMRDQSGERVVSGAFVIGYTK